MNKKAKNNTYKPADVFDQFVKEVFGESPLDEAFKNWNKTTKKIKKMREKRDEHKRTR